MSWTCFHSRSISDRVNVDLTILFGSVSSDDIALKEELEQLKSDRLRIVHVLSGDEPDWPGERGFLSAELIRKYAEGDCTFFICGLGEEDFCSLPAELVERFKSEYQNSELLIGAKGNEPVTLPIPSKPKLTGRASNGKEHQNPER